MRSAYRALAGLIALGVVLQAAFIALGWFTVLGDLEGGAVLDANMEYNAGQAMHAIFGMIIIPLLGLALLVVSFFARLPGGVRWAGIVFGVAVLQVLLAFMSFGAPIVGLLHGANALVLAIVAGRAAGLASSTRVVGRSSAPPATG